MFVFSGRFIACGLNVASPTGLVVCIGDACKKKKFSRQVVVRPLPLRTYPNSSCSKKSLKEKNEEEATKRKRKEPEAETAC